MKPQVAIIAPGQMGVAVAARLALRRHSDHVREPNSHEVCRRGAGES